MNRDEPYAAKEAVEDPKPPAPLGGRYACRSLIGEGGAARVWSAEDTVLGRRVAVKVLRGEWDEKSYEEVCDQFEREARIMAAIQHPTVVRVLDFGLSDDGMPFLVMEQLEGRTLGDVVDVGAVPVAQALVTLVAVLGGLAAIHDRGIVHGDLKPENVFLAKSEDGEYPVLLDFGVSRATNPGAGLRSVRTTVKGRVRGTPHYMSPEQTRGWKTDGRSDLYALGAVAFELLTGRVPFDNENPIDAMIDIATKPAPPVRSVQPDIPEAMAMVVDKVLRTKPEDRYPDARSMRSALVRAAEGIPGFPAVLVRTLAPSDSGLLDLGVSIPPGGGPSHVVQLTPARAPTSSEADLAFPPAHPDSETRSEPPPGGSSS